METYRILGIVPLALISLMNVGYPFGTDPEPRAATAVLVAVLGLAGLLAAYGLGRGTPWGVPAAVAVGAVSVVGGVVALAAGVEGAAIGLVVSAVALALALAALQATRRVTMA